MADQKPPRATAGELETLLLLLQYQRESLVRKVSGLSDVQALQPRVPSGTNLVWLMRHMRNAEIIWILYRFAGQDIDVPDDTLLPEGTLEEAATAYRQTWPYTDSIVLAAASLDAAAAREPDVNLRWILMHLLEETARHAGHADILRELIDGQTGR